MNPKAQDPIPCVPLLQQQPKAQREFSSHGEGRCSWRMRLAKVPLAEGIHAVADLSSWSSIVCGVSAWVLEVGHLNEGASSSLDTWFRSRARLKNWTCGCWVVGSSNRGTAAGIYTWELFQWHFDSIVPDLKAILMNATDELDRKLGAMSMSSISSASQVPPAELEALFVSHPLIADAEVVSQNDEGVGEAPVAFVIRSNGSELTKEAVKEFIAKQVVFYKKLHKVYFVQPIPKSPCGKILSVWCMRKSSRSSKPLFHIKFVWILLFLVSLRVS
ncbi:hypothetical protein Drorol1_Dr00026014 [Drosera rotundifolia]